MKVAIIQRRIPNFRISIFEMLSLYRGIDLTVFYAEGNSALYSFKTSRYSLFRIGKIFFCTGLIYKLLKEKYDVIVFEGRIAIVSFPIYIIILKLCRKKVCLWTSTFEPEISKITKIIRKMLTYYIAKIVDHIIVYSTKAKTYYEQLGIEDYKISIAYNSLNHHSLLECEKYVDNVYLKYLCEKYALENRDVLLYVGKIEKAKRLDLLLRAYALLIEEGVDNLALIIVGDGRLRRYFESYVKDLQLPNVYFVGEIRQDDILIYYFKLARFVVVSGMGGMRELLEGGGQIICTNFKELRKCIEWLLNNPEKSKRLGEKGYNFAKKFDLHCFEIEWVKLIEELSQK